MPPIEAVLSAYRAVQDVAEVELTTDDCPYAPYKWHNSIRPRFMLWIPHKLTNHRLDHSYKLSVAFLAAT